jgi:hypothetical protein
MDIRRFAFGLVCFAGCVVPTGDDLQPVSIASTMRPLQAMSMSM